MMKMFTRGFLSITFLILSLFAFTNANSQCANTMNWDLNPPPVNGAYEPGQVITACLTITTYQQASASWLHGIVLDFPPGWDVSTVTNASGPDACSFSNGTWNYYPNGTTATGSGQTFGAGFFYDANSGGPQDGNPGNNWGDPCTTAGQFGSDFTFCFDITISDDCGGGGNPLDGNDITPSVQITGDGQSGSWGGTWAPCEQSAATDPDVSPMTINCCDAESGISPGTLSICENGTFNLFDELIVPTDGPIDVGGFWTGPAGYTDPSGLAGLGTFDPTSDPAGEYTYTVFGTDNCISSTSIIMEFNTLGLVQSVAYCETGPTDLGSELTVMPLPPGGTWYAPGYPGTQVVVPAGVIDPNVSPPGIYTYVYYDAGNCLTTLNFQITFATGGAAGLPGSAEICTSDPGCYQPFYSLGGNPTEGGNWIVYDSTGTAFLSYIVEWDNCFDMETFHPNYLGSPYYGDFIFTYILGAPPCTPALVDIEVDVYEPVNTGTTTIASVCITDPPFILETLLEGTPDMGLDWSDAITEVPVPNLLDPSTYAAGTNLQLLYSGGLAGTSCESNTVLELTILPSFAYAGENSTITLCQADPSLFMYDTIPGNGTDIPQTGGLFTDGGGNSYGSFFTPGSNPPGTYEFTYSITSTCADDQSTLTIVLEPTLNPGMDGTLDICDNETGVALSGGLNGSFDPGGVWTNGSGVVVPSTVDGSALAGGEIFTYTVGSTQCAESADVTINLIPSPNAGILTTAPQNYCDSDAPLALMTLFTTGPSTPPGPDAGWTDPMGNAVTTVNPANGSAASGVYTYTINDTGCGPASVSITITIEDTPSAGTDATVTACPNGTGTIDLFAALGGTPVAGGSWTGPGGPSSGIFNPAAADPAGVYTYTVGTNCTDQSTVTVSYTTLPNPGTATSITVCAGDPAFLLIDEMPPGSTQGTWSTSGNPNFGNTFNPASDLGGVYTNTVNAGACPSVSATLTITVTPLPDAGSNATESFCETAGFVDLTSYLGGTPDSPGAWTDGGGNAVTNPLNVTSLCGNSYVYTYTVGSGTCSSSSTLSFDVICTPSAGTDGTLDLCSNDANFSLFTGLTGTYDTGGEWTNSGGTILDPTNMNPAALGTGDTFTYTVTANPCVTASADVVVGITPAMTSQNVVANCTPAQTDYILTFEITGGQPPYSISAGNPGSIVGNVYTSTAIVAGTNYSVTISDASSCGDLVVSGVSPNCSCPVAANFSTGNQTICIGGSADIGLALTGGIDGQYTVTYSAGGNPQPLITGASNGDVITVSPVVTTTYLIESVTDGNCAGTVNGSSVTITVDPLNDAGNDVTQDYCGDGSSLVLSPEAGEPTNGTFNPASIILNTANAGDYNYTVANGQCPADIAVYTINIDEPLSTSLVQASCEPNQTEYTVSFTINGGTGPYTVNGETLPLGENTYTSAVIPTPTGYSFTISDSGPCGDITLNGNAPNCNCPVTAGFSTGNQTICIGSSVDLILSLGGGTDGDYTIGYNAGVTPQTQSGLSNGDAITVSPTVTTTYTLTSAEDSNCQTSVNGSVTITVEQLPNAGNDVTTDYCGDGSTLVLTPGPGEPAGGTFSPASIPLNEGTPTATYTVAGNVCPDDIALYTLNIDPLLEITNLTAVCASNQLEYTVSFTIVGGTPPYSINGSPDTFTTTFSETLIFADNATYNYTISDSGPCNDVIIDEIAPDCNCIAEGSISGTTSICFGDCADIIFNGIGDGPFNITYFNSTSGTSTSLTNINNGHVISACPAANTTYELTAVSDSYCEGVVSGNSVSIDVDSPVVVSNVTEICNNTAESYQVEFTYTGGVGPYTFVPVNTSTTPGTYLSAPISSGLGYNITVVDAGACPNVVVSSSSYTCDCISDAGSMAASSFEVCFGESASVSTNGTEMLDGNDVLQYVLHDGNPGSIGTVIATSPNGSFTFNYGAMVPGAAYYIHAVVGNNIGGGNVNLNDDCTSLSNGVQVVMNALPTATITGGGIVCPGETVDLLVTRTGEGPWDFEYAVSGDVQENVTVTSGDQFILTVTQPGQYTLISTSDSNCTGSVSGNGTVQNYETPTATLSGEPTVCEGSGDGPQVVFTGDGPWSFVYSIDGENQEMLSNTNFPTYTIPVEEDGNYALVSLEGANCPGTVSGSQEVTILASPTAAITGGGTVCAGDSATFDVVLTGTGPWNVQYTVDGVPQNQLTGITDGYSFESSVDGDYVLVSVSDANCTGEVLTSQASLSVNPLPTGEITTSKSSVCIGEEVEIGIDLEGVPPFSVTYVINGDTTTATGLYSDYFETLQPENPVNFEVLFIEDGSNPTCSSEPMDYTYIDAVVLPNAPVLTSDTICSYNGPVNIGVNSAPGLTYSWSPEEFLSAPNSSNTLFQPTLGGPYAKTFEYVLTATNGECSATDTMTVTVEPGPRANFSFSPDPVSSEDPTVFFQNKTVGRDEVFYFWEFDSLDTSNEFEPVYKFPDGINDSYSITLTAIDPITGCMDEYTDLLQIKPEMLIYVPSAFTPDGDGTNDLWGPVLTNVDEDDYKLSVYNRYGLLVFSTTDVNQKWNGGMMNDNYYVEPGVYVWMIETKNSVSLDEIDMKGIVTVVR